MAFCVPFSNGFGDNDVGAIVFGAYTLQLRAALIYGHHGCSR
jgi:hypothetical protein